MSAAYYAAACGVGCDLAIGASFAHNLKKYGGFRNIRNELWDGYWIFQGFQVLNMFYIKPIDNGSHYYIG